MIVRVQFSSMLGEIDRRQRSGILNAERRWRIQPAVTDSTMSEPTPGASGIRRGFKMVFRTGIVAVLALAFLAPAASQIFCSTTCEGGQCEVPEPVAVCEIDAGGCCDSECDAERLPSSTNLAAARLQTECLPCSCFQADEIGCFVPSRHEASIDLQFTPTTDIHTPRDGRQIVEWAAVMPMRAPRAHAPPTPIYCLNHSLLI